MTLKMPSILASPHGLTLSRDQWQAACDFAIEGSLFPGSEYHGQDHWRAVASQGLRLAEIARLGRRGRATAALFGLFHDCRRENDDWDPEHGARAAEALYASPIYNLLDYDLRTSLMQSMDLHDGGQTTTDPLIGLGWDADRSTLGRVGIVPAVGFFSVIPHEDFIQFIEDGAAATRAPMSWDEIFDAAFG